MDRRVEIDVVLPHPPERVWRALTDRELLAEWLMPNDFEPQIGRRFTFRPRRDGSLIVPRPIRCEIVELVVSEKLAYSWDDRSGDLPDLVTWTLEPTREGTRVRLEHTKPSDSEPSAKAAATAMLWCVSAMRLERFLAGKLLLGRAAILSDLPEVAQPVREYAGSGGGLLRC